MFNEDRARDMIADLCESRGRSAEARALRNGHNVMIPAEIVVEAIIASYEKGAEYAAEMFAGDD